MESMPCSGVFFCHLGGGILCLFGAKGMGGEIEVFIAGEEGWYI